MQNCAQALEPLFFDKIIIYISFFFINFYKLLHQTLILLEIDKRVRLNNFVLMTINRQNEDAQFYERSDILERTTGWFRSRGGVRRRGGKYEEAFARALKSFRNSLNAERGLFQDGGFGQRTKFSKRGRNRRPKHDETP